MLAVDLSLMPHQVIDNQDATYAEIGSNWQTYSNAAAHQGNLRYHAAGDGSDTATWAFSGLDPAKTYQLYATWNADSGHASNAPYALSDGNNNPLVIVRINQQATPNQATLDGENWQSLGVFQASTGSLNVSLSDLANGYVVADALCAAEVTPPTTAVSLVDNADAAYTETGSSWLGWTGAGTYQGDLRYAPAGTGENKATWTFDNLDPAKTYQVYATWNADSGHASNAPYTVLDGASPLATIRLNQQSVPTDITLDNWQWQSAGVYQAASGQLTVQLSDDANGYVVADSVRIVEVTPPAAPPTLVDDGDVGFAQSGEGWLSWSGSSVFQGDCRYAPAGTGQNTSTWTFNGLDPAKTYQVYATWNADSGHASNAPYTVLDGASPLATVRLNQQATPTDATIDNWQWQSAGVYCSTSGQLVVRLSDDANGYVVADAVRIVEVTPATPPLSVIDNGDAVYAESGNSWLGWSGSSVYAGDCRYAPAGSGQSKATWSFSGLDPARTYQVYATWNGDSGHASNAPFTVLDGNNPLATVRLNQQATPTDIAFDNFTWQSAGIYRPTSGQLTVQLSDDANGYVVADAVRIVQLPLQTTTPSVIDDGDAAYAETGSAWLGWSGAGTYQGDCRYAPAGTGQNTATWSFSGLTPLWYYQLLATYPADSNHASNAPFTVLDGTNTLATVPINQQVAPSGPTIDNQPWQNLGTFCSTSGNLSVKLSDSANGYVVADAVRVVPVAPLTLYWDADGNAANNSVGNGAGLGGSGTWTAGGGNLWYDPVTGQDGPWVNGAQAVFTGSGGTVTLSGTLSASKITVTGGNLTIQSGTINLPTSGGTNLEIDGGTTTLSSTITGTGGLTKSGSGTLVLSGSNTFGGGVAIGGSGVLQVGSAGALNASSPNAVTFAVGSTGILRLAGYSLTVAGLSTVDATSTAAVENGSGTAVTLTVNASTSSTFAGIFRKGSTGNLSLVKSGTGVLTLTGNSSTSIGGNVTVSGGTLAISSGGKLSSVVSVIDGPNASAVVSGTGSSWTSSSTLTVGNSTSGNTLTVSGGGQVTATGNATIGYASGANYNTVTVTGPGSSFTTGSTLDVGRQGSYNSLSVANGGTASGYLFYLSGGPGNPSGAGNNTVTVSGSGSTLTVASSWDLADRGVGNQFNVLAGGTASMSGAGYVGYYSGSASTITVDGAGSTWNTGNVDFGTGTSNQVATVSNGAAWNAAGTVTVKNSNAVNLNSSGTLNANSVNLSTMGARLNISGGTLSARQAGSLVTGSGQVSLLGPGTVSTNYTTTTIPVVISGSGGLIKAGTGTLSLTAANTYGGGTAINAGTLAVSGGAAIPDTSTVTLANVSGAALNLFSSETIGGLAGGGASGGNVSLGFSTLTVGANSTNTAYAGVISGTSSLTKVGSGTQTLSGVNTFTGGTTISSGTLQIGDGGTTGSIAGNVVDNANLSFNRADDLTYAGSISGSGSLSKLAADTLTLSGANTFTGGTTISAGTLMVGAGGTTGSIAGNIVDNANLSFNRSDNVTYAGAISGSGTVTKLAADTLTLSGANTYTSSTIVSAGTLAVTGGAAIPDASAVSLDGSSGATLSLLSSETIGSLAGGGYVTVGGNVLTLGGDNTSTGFGGVISGTGSLVKTGTGLFALSGANTFTGGTTVSSGTLSVNTLSDSGPSALGNTGTITVYNATFQYTGTDAVSTSRYNAGGYGGGIAGTTVIDVSQSAASLTLNGGYDNYNQSLSKTGPGTLVLSGVNVLGWGSAGVHGGTLVLAAKETNSGLYTTVSDINAIDTGATLRFAPYSDGVFYYQMNQNGDFNFTMTGGTVDLNGDALGGQSISEPRGTGVITNSSTTPAVLNVGIFGSHEFSGNVRDGAGTVALAFYGGSASATWKLSGNNTYTGGTVLSGNGAVQLGSDTALPTNRPLQLGDVNSGPGVLDLNGHDLALTGLFTAAKSDAHNTYWDEVLNSVASNAAKLTITNSADYFFGGHFDGNLAIDKFGTGKLTVDGVSNNSGAVQVYDGTLDVTGCFIGPVSVVPGAGDPNLLGKVDPIYTVLVPSPINGEAAYRTYKYLNADGTAIDDNATSLVGPTDQVFATDWRAAVYKSVRGGVSVPQTQQLLKFPTKDGAPELDPTTHDAFLVGTVKELKMAVDGKLTTGKFNLYDKKPDGSFVYPGIVSDDTKLIVFEDLTNMTNNDRDYDDAYWVINAVSVDIDTDSNNNDRIDTNDDPTTGTDDPIENDPNRAGKFVSGLADVELRAIDLTGIDTSDVKLAISVSGNVDLLNEDSSVLAGPGQTVLTNINSASIAARSLKVHGRDTYGAASVTYALVGGPFGTLAATQARDTVKFTVAPPANMKLDQLETGNPDSPGNGVANFLPGYRGDTPVLTPSQQQAVNVVVNNINPSVGNTVNFRLAGTSHWQGIASNMNSTGYNSGTDGYNSGANDPDYAFDRAGSQTLDGQTVTYTTIDGIRTGSVTVPMMVSDFGGKTTVQILTTGGLIFAEMTVPLDSDGDGLPDKWEDQYVAQRFYKTKAQSIAGTNDGSRDGDTNVGGAKGAEYGDLIPASDEYRGFFVKGSDSQPTHVRTDPTVKDVFAVDKTGYSITDGGGNAFSIFASAANVNFHEVLASETGANHSIDFNSPSVGTNNFVQQRAIFVNNGGHPLVSRGQYAAGVTDGYTPSTNKSVKIDTYNFNKTFQLAVPVDYTSTAIIYASTTQLNDTSKAFLPKEGRITIDGDVIQYEQYIASTTYPDAKTVAGGIIPTDSATIPFDTVPDEVLSNIKIGNEVITVGGRDSYFSGASVGVYTLGQACTAAPGSAIVLVPNNAVKQPPAGQILYVKLDAEWISYTGISPVNEGAQLTGVRRGQLGSVPAAHTLSCAVDYPFQYTNCTRGAYGTPINSAADLSTQAIIPVDVLSGLTFLGEPNTHQTGDPFRAYANDSDFRIVVAHELMHAIGADFGGDDGNGHIDSSPNIMYSSDAFGEYDGDSWKAGVFLSTTQLLINAR